MSIQTVLDLSKNNNILSSLQETVTYTQLERLYLNQTNVTHLPAFATSLKELHLENSFYLKKIAVTSSLELLNCSRSPKLKEIPLLVNLTYLNCSSCIKATLPYLPNLTYLNCNNMQSKKLPELSVKLKKMHLMNNCLTSVDFKHLTNLTSLHIERNKLTDIILPTSLIKLYCDDNEIKKLDLTNLNLIKLDCSRNKLVTPIYLPTTLTCLYISSNGLPDLGNISQLHKLDFLACFNNSLKYLPRLTSLTKLYCEYNNLEFIDIPNLLFLHANNNQLTSIHSLTKLTDLDVGLNKLTSLPNMPNIEYLLVSYNPLKLLPYIPKVQKLWVDDTKITTLPNIPKAIALCLRNTGIKMLPPINANVNIYADENQLLFTENRDWIIFHKFKNLYYQLKYGKKIEAKFIKFRNRNLNNEILFAPHLKNYKQFANPLTLSTML
jgi:hypothetical protein